MAKEQHGYADTKKQPVKAAEIIIFLLFSY